MYTQEVLRAMYKNHGYEYLIINQSFKVLEYSPNISLYCHDDSFKKQETDIFMAIPELIGMEEGLADLFEDKSNSNISIPMLFREPKHYFNLDISKINENENENENEKGKGYETLLILLEDVSIRVESEHRALQDHNEKRLLLDEIADKNRQLEVFNQEMQRLVAEEIEKNREKQRMLELKSRHSQMGEMIGLITHQWKQPLNMINVNCGLLRMKYDMGMLTQTIFDKQVSSILEQSDHMNQTVSDFQHFFNPSKEKEYFTIMKTMKSILSLVGIDYTLNNISLILKGDEEVMGFGYPNEYNQVILSLLQNAKDAFLENPKENMQIEIRVSKQKSGSLVTIKDNAGGIPKSLIAQIFGQYMTSKEEGSGLGLHIAKSVIEEHMEGKIWVENIDSGAMFSIELLL
jgi:signal transduction histidine kinase